MRTNSSNLISHQLYVPVNVTYTIVIRTGNVDKAGTDATVFVYLVGENGTTGTQF